MYFPQRLAAQLMLLIDLFQWLLSDGGESKGREVAKEEAEADSGCETTLL